jgi:Flp pilus assembly protein TadD
MIAIGSIRASRRELIFVFLLAASVALLVSLPSIGNGFVLDDVGVIQENETVHELSLGRLVTSTYWPVDKGGAMWRPAALVGFSMQWVLGGGSPLLFHLVNVVLYALVAGLVASVTARLFDARLGLIAGILFAVHPVHVEVTANVVGQTELLAAVGYLIALWAAWERVQTRSGPARYFLMGVVVGGLVLSLASKEYLVTFPAVVLVLWWLHRMQDRESAEGILSREWPVLAASMAIIGSYLTVSLKWFELLFAPLRLSANYELRHLVPEPVFGVKHVLALALWIGLLVLAWRRRRELPEVVVGTALFLVTISIVSNVVVPTGVILAERLLFLPSFGWAVAVSGILVAGADKMESQARRVLVIGVSIVALLAGLHSVLRAGVWRDNEVFFNRLLKDAPNSFRAHWAVGEQAFDRGDSILGEREMRLAVQLNPDHPYLLEDLGLRYYVTGRNEPAIPLLDRAVAVDSNRLSSALPLARALARAGEAARALAVLDAMAGVHGETRGINLVRSEVLLMAGEPEQALQSLLPLVEREPRVWTLRGMLAQAAAGSGRCEMALAQLDTALQLAPANVQGELIRLRARVANGNAPCK